MFQVCLLLCFEYMTEDGKGNYRTKKKKITVYSQMPSLSFPVCLRQTLIGTSLFTLLSYPSGAGSMQKQHQERDKSGQPHISLLVKVSFHLFAYCFLDCDEKKKNCIAGKKSLYNVNIYPMQGSCPLISPLAVSTSFPLPFLQITVITLHLPYYFYKK